MGGSHHPHFLVEPDYPQRPCESGLGPTTGPCHDRAVMALGDTPRQQQERRTHPRYRVWFPVQIDAGRHGTAVGISEDASAKGLLVHSNAELVVGAPVRLRFRVSSHEVPQDIEGTVVRAHRNRSHKCDWPYRIAVEFDDADPTLDERLHVELLQQQPGLRA